MRQFNAAGISAHGAAHSSMQARPNLKSLPGPSPGEGATMNHVERAISELRAFDARVQKLDAQLAGSEAAARSAEAAMTAAAADGSGHKAALEAAALAGARVAALKNALTSLRAGRPALVVKVGEARKVDIKNETAALLSDIAERRDRAAKALKAVGQALGGEFSVDDLKGWEAWAKCEVAALEARVFSLEIEAGSTRAEHAGRDLYAAALNREACEATV
jgi:hypothetical protein